MTLSPAMQMAQRRIMLFCLGFVSGLVLWLLAENWDNPKLPAALYLALMGFFGSYATLCLALIGPVSVRRAMVGALILAVPFTALMSLAGLRYELATDVLDNTILVSVSLLLMIVATPFLIVSLQDRHAWETYVALFETAWALTIRYLLAWIFVGLFWSMMFLSDALLSLVNVQIIEWLMDIDWLNFALTGGVLGLAMAVIFELRATVSPYLLLRLLRLLVVPVLAVVTLFLAAIPLRGLSQVFGEFSAAATLMSVALVMITLVAVVLERDDDRMRDSVTISISTQLLALLLPLVTGLAGWSIWMRVAEYGWTPDRVLAACVSAILLGYGALYALSVLRRSGWAARIRQANVGLAVVTLVISAAFLTPILNTDRIAANSQVARFLDGRLQMDDLPLWEMQNDWGRAGLQAIMALESSARGKDPVLVERLQELRRAEDRWAFRRLQTADNLDLLKAEIVELTPIRPVGRSLRVEDLEGLAQYELNSWLSGCQLILSDGRPGCALIMDQFDPWSDDNGQGMLFYRNSDRALAVKVNLLTFDTQGQAALNSVNVLTGEPRPRFETRTLKSILDGQYSVGPSSLRALHVGGREIMARP